MPLGNYSYYNHNKKVKEINYWIQLIKLTIVC